MSDLQAVQLIATLVAAAVLPAMSTASVHAEPNPAHPMTTGPHVLMRLSGADLGPFAYTHFCHRYPADCDPQDPSSGPDRVALNGATLGDLRAVNTMVNRAITPMQHAGERTFDTWRIGPASGDCNDYAVTKRHLLMQHGWPSRALLLAEVVTGWGDHHLILVARTSGADLVLDNLSERVRDWTAAPYTWVRAQMPGDPSLWAKVDSPSRWVAQQMANGSVDHQGAQATN